MLQEILAEFKVIRLIGRIPDPMRSFYFYLGLTAGIYRILCCAGILFLYYYSIKITGAAASTYSLVQAGLTGIQIVVDDPTGKTDFTG